MTLKTIKEHNQEVYRQAMCNLLTGVACPNCKDQELQFRDHTMMLTNPPQKDVVCFVCNYTGRLYV